MSDIRFIHSTFENETNAETVGHELVEKNLVGCVNIGSSVTSIFPWEGSIQTETEIPFLAKTTVDQLDEVIAYLRDVHPYDCPEIIVTRTEKVESDYEDWLKQTTESS